MPIKNYGVWKATPTAFSAQRAAQDPESPHGHLEFKDGVNTTKRLSSAINVKSISSDSRLVYWLFQDFQHPLTDHLRSLRFGFRGIERNDKELALDLLRSGAVDVAKGRIVPHDLPGDGNDIIDFLTPFFKNAISKKATVYIYGEQYSGKDGVHDVHMNQGSDGRFKSQNGIHQDGGLILEFPDGHWEAFFIAFASQSIKTTDDGHPAGPVFGKFLENLGNGDGTQPPIDTGGDDTGNEHPSPSTVAIEAALVNPEGPDNEENQELVYLVNNDSASVSLKDWTIENHMQMSYRLPSDAELKIMGAKQAFKVPGVPLSNKGGSITLKNAKAQVMDEVRYTREQASRSGQLLYFN